MKLLVKHWKEMQHYKDRSPAWIKLHRRLIDDFDFQTLPVESRALAPMLWLIASESDDGSIDARYDALAFRLRQSEREIEKAIKPLIEKGFFAVDSESLADGYQLAPADEPANKPAKASIPNCPHQAIIDAYSEILPELAQVMIWSKDDEKNLSARWKWLMTDKKKTGERRAETAEQGIEWFERFFNHVRKSPFLMGQTQEPFSASLKWFVVAKNFAKVLEGNYHKDSQ